MHTEGLRLNCHVYVSLRKQRHLRRVSLILIVLFCLNAPQLIVQSSIQNDWRRKHISNTNSLSTYRRGNQIFKKFCFNRHTKITLPSFCFCRIYNTCRNKAQNQSCASDRKTTSVLIITYFKSYNIVVIILLQMYRVAVLAVVDILQVLIQIQ